MHQITRVFDLLPYNHENFDKPILIAGKTAGKWVNYSTDDLISHANKVSRGLIKLGIKKDSMVANMSANRPEWNFVDFGIMQIGAVHVPMYPTLPENDIKFIMNDAGVEILFVATADLYNKVASVRNEIPTLREIYSYEKIEGVKHWSEVLEMGSAEPLENLQPYQDNVQPDDLLTLIYTSGTTGTPKGVMLTHDNLVSNFKSSGPLVPLNNDAKALSFLPLSHIFERMVVYMYLSKGISIHYAESMETISDNLKEVKPNVFSTVPRLLEKVYDRIVAKGHKLTGIKKQLFFWALKLGLKYEFDGANGWWYETQLKIARKLIFSKWKEALGNNVFAIISGGAALQPRLARVFAAAGMPALEGYGLTETSPVISVNQPYKGMAMFGSVGPTIENVQIKIAEDGEVLCKGPNVMKGYYKRPDLTAETIDADGWFHTGDIGTIVDNKFLKITDRKKEIFKTAGGKYIAPQVLENKLKESPLIEQLIVIGENERFAAALIVPTFTALKDWCERKNIVYSNPEEMIKNPDVIEKIQIEVDKCNVGLGKWETIKKFELLPKEWSIDSGELTPKLSLKRKVIMQKYKLNVDNIYANAEKLDSQKA